MNDFSRTPSEDACLPWLGRIPSHWRVERAKWLYRQMARPVRDGDEVVTCFRDGTVMLRKDRRTLGFTNSLKEIGYQGVRRGDLVIHAMDAFAGAVGVSNSDGKCTPVYAVCTARGELDNRYYAYVIREMARSKWILALARGIRERSTDFRFETFGSQLLPLPPLDEQKAIAAYLDANATQVRRLIHNRRRLIELLNEQRRAIITRVVTRGIDRVRLKPSGVDWLGEVPEHWRILRAKYVFREIDQRSENGDETHLSMSQVRGLVPSDSLEERRLLSESYAGGKLCWAGDLVLNRLKAHLGVFAVASVAGVVSPDYTVFRARESSNVKYHELVLRSERYRPELRRRAKGIVQGFWRLYTDDFYGIPLPVPPLGEQQQIVERVGHDTARLDMAIDKAQEEIALVLEYRIRLVADVVTGKVDVQHLAVAQVGEMAEVSHVPEAEAPDLVEETIDGE